MNNGFFVVEPEAPRYIEGDTMWEHAATEEQLYAYQHGGPGNTWTRSATCGIGNHSGKGVSLLRKRGRQT